MPAAMLRTSVLGRIAAVAIVIGVAVAAPVVIEAGPETQAATEMPIMAEAAVRRGKVLTRRAAAQSPARTAKMAPAKAAAQVSAAEPAAYVSAAAESAHMAATESAAHMSATTETAGVSTPTAAAVATPAERKRVSAQSPGESGSRSKNDYGLT
jgi:hypothetical protein